MNRTMFRCLFVGLAIIFFLSVGTEAAELGKADSGQSQMGVATQERTDGASRTGGWVRHRNREEMTLGIQESMAPRAFKLTASGGIDLASGVVLFGGNGTHLGLYRGNGFLDPTFAISGSLLAANGDALNFVASFSFGQMGEIAATFVFSGGTGRFEDAAGQASGPVVLNPDFSFVIDVSGYIIY